MLFNLRLQSEEAQLDRLRNDTAQAANHEAAILGSLRGQIADLQNVLNSMGHQLAAEQAMRRADGQAFDLNMKQMEASIQAAQEGVVNRTVAMIEAKAQGFIAAIKELDVSELNFLHMGVIHTYIGDPLHYSTPGGIPGDTVKG